MADEKRPTVLTVLAVLALIGAIFSVIFGIIGLIGSFPMMAISVGAGLFLLLAALCALASGAVGILAAVKIFGDKPKGVNFLKLYAYIGIGWAVLTQIGTIISGAGFSFGGLIRSLVFPAIVLIIIFTQQSVKDYESRVG
ncbi:MAG: hypothetical protein JXA20_14890 [Spirochaetes bacterium]|nr:hypothetical protein [Spirochaetota bacterium]